jgi:hypothetical protein
MAMAVAGGWRHGWIVACVLALTGSAASAMGGHFDVDDAAVLAPERCQIELWTVGRGESARLWHVGPACRVGPVELGLVAESVSIDERHARIVGAQAKVAGNWLPHLDGGLVVAAARDTTRRLDLITVYVPVTWSVSRSVNLHAIVGGDHTSDGRQTGRLGAAGEWALDERFTLLAERFRAFGITLTRLGLRLAVGEHASIDFSAARVSNTGNRLWGLGWSWEFGP